MRPPTASNSLSRMGEGGGEGDKETVFHRLYRVSAP